MKLYMIAKSNIKKNISISVTLTLLILFATLLLYIGTSVVLDINTFVDKKNVELNGSDFTVVAPSENKEQVESTLIEMDQFLQLETEEAIIKPSADIQNITKEKKSQTIGYLLLNADQARDISKLKILDEGDKKLKNSIILPYFLKISEGYQTGDEVRITYGGKTYSYIIYGFSEDILFASPSNISFFKCYVFNDTFQSMYHNETGVSKSLYIKTKLASGTDTDVFEANFIKNIQSKSGKTETYTLAVNYDIMKVGVSFFLIIAMAIFIVLAFIIVIIALTVIRFAIITHIEGSIKNIGSMEALGYTANQLILATIFQFILIAFLGICIGLFLAGLSTGFVTNLVSATIGLAWNSRINLIAFFISFSSIMFLVVAISYIATVKIKKITPIMALRNGLDTHNFKKNYFPLSKSSLNVNVSLGLKSLFQNIKQNVTILIIVILMSFVCVFSFTANYNFNVDNSAFIRLIGVEKSHLSVVYLGEDSDQIFDEISKLKHIQRTARVSSMGMKLHFADKEVTPEVVICNDFNLLEINTIVNGRYPIHDNEIAITGVVSDVLNAKLGDVLTIKGSEQNYEFIIVGITQQISHLGKSASITDEGMRRMNPAFKPFQLNLYLTDADKISLVTKTIEDNYGHLDLNVNNVEEFFQTILATFNSAAIMLCTLGVSVTLIVITLILYLLIKIRLLKERTRIGIAKALGYTTKQLVLQIVVSFSPVCILGALIGTFMAMYLINPAFAAMLAVSGIRNSNLLINPMVTIITFLAISLFSIVITVFVSMRIRKITPQELFI